MDSKRLILAALLSVIVLVGWGLLFPPAERQAPMPTEQTPAFPEPAPDGGLGAIAPPRPVAADSVVADRAEARVEPAARDLPPLAESVEREIEVENDVVIVRFSNRGAQLVSLRLKATAGRDGPPLEMVSARAQGPYPFAFMEADGSESALNRVLFVAGQTRDGVRFQYRGPEGAAVKEFTFDAGGLFEVGVTLEGRTDWSLLLGPGLRNPDARELKGTYTLRRQASYAVADQIESLDANKPGEPTIVSGNGIRWIGLEDTYFLTALIPSDPFRSATVEAMLQQPTDQGENMYLPYPQQLREDQEDLRAEYRILLNPGSERFVAQAFWGAKYYDELGALPGGHGLEKTVRFGWFGLFAVPMMWALLWIHDNIVQNFGWSIVLLTLCIKILMAPLTHKSYVSSRKMQALQPKMAAIKAKWRPKLKDKKGRPNMEAQRKQNEELQALMKAEGVNPLGGCLPILLQMPFFFSFFALLRNSAELWNAPWAFWIHDLSAKDPFFVLPIIMGASQFLQQRLIGSTSMEPSQRMMMNIMPIMFMFFFMQAPSGLVLYWVTSNLLTIAQQGVYQRLRSKGILGGGDSS